MSETKITFPDIGWWWWWKWCQLQWWWYDDDDKIKEVTNDNDDTCIDNDNYNGGDDYGDSHDAMMMMMLKMKAVVTIMTACGQWWWWLWLNVSILETFVLSCNKASSLKHAFTTISHCFQCVLYNTTINLYLPWFTYSISNSPRYLIPRSAIVYNRVRKLGDNTMRKHLCITHRVNTRRMLF